MVHTRFAHDIAYFEFRRSIYSVWQSRHNVVVANNEKVDTFINRGNHRYCSNLSRQTPSSCERDLHRACPRIFPRGIEQLSKLDLNDNF